MVTKKEINYNGYGKCLELTNDTVRVVVTLELGPRVIRYSFLEGENIFFEDTAHAFCEKGEAFDEHYGKGAAWYIYGGHRLWTSPEVSPRTYYPDNDPVACELTDKGAVFTPPPQKWNQYGYAIEVTLADSGPDVTVRHRITNYAAWEVTLAPWAISVLSPGGTEVVPMPVRDAGMLANRQLALWTYTDLRDSRLTWLERYMLLRQDSSAKGPFKVGVNSEHGFAMYFNHGDVLVKQFEAKQDGHYPDGGMSFETYTNPLFLEMESLGELKTMAPGETVEHTERWSLYKGNPPVWEDAAIDEAVAAYLGR